MAQTLIEEWDRMRWAGMGWDGMEWKGKEWITQKNKQKPNTLKILKKSVFKFSSQ